MTQCKRYAPKHKVTVEAVRELYGVVESEKATSGLIITTSTFTKPAKAFQEKNKFRLSLVDMDDLKKWLIDLKSRV
jgi:restriction system protein